MPHEVESLLKQQATQALSPKRAHQCKRTLLNADNVTLNRCNTLNAATGLPIPGEGEERPGCDIVIRNIGKPKADLTDLPLQNPDLVLFTDGLSCYLHGQRKAGCAIADKQQVVDTRPLPATVRAQGAELIPLVQAARPESGRRVTTYTDSRCASGLCHATGRLWKERGFLTSSAKAVANGPEIWDFLDAIQLPKETAVVHCPAHTRDTAAISKENALADAAAKAAARQPW